MPCPPPGVLLNSGKELTFLTSPTLAGGFFTTSTTWKAHIPYVSIFSKVFILNACRIFFYMLKKWRCGVWEHPLCRLLALILISALKPLPALSSSLWEKPFQNINWIMSFSCLKYFSGPSQTVSKSQTSYHDFHDSLPSNSCLSFLHLRSSCVQHYIWCLLQFLFVCFISLGLGLGCCAGCSVAAESGATRRWSTFS